MAVKTEAILTSLDVDSGNIIRFCLDLGSKIEFRPGQYGRLKLTNPKYTDDRGRSRSLTILGYGENRNIVCFATKIGPSAFKRSLLESNIERIIEFTGPFGSFIRPAESHQCIFIAGDIGITPVAAFFRRIPEMEGTVETAVFHIAGQGSEFPLSEDMKKLESALSSAKYIQIRSSSGKVSGGSMKHLTFEDMKSNLTARGISDSVFYISGPNRLIEDIEPMLLENGIAKERIRVEVFPGY